MIDSSAVPKPSLDAFNAYYNQFLHSEDWNYDMKSSTVELRNLITPSVFAMQNLLYLDSIVINMVTPENFYMKRKNFKSFQIQYTLAGHGRLAYQDQEYDLLPGDCYFIDCMEPHHFCTVGNANWIHHGIQFNGAVLDAIFQEFSRSHPVKVTLGLTGEVSSLFTEIARVSFSKLSSAELIINQLLWSLLSKILLYHQVISELQLSPHIALACQYIDKHFSTIQSIGELAEVCFLSKFHLCREFKSQTGRTIVEYLTTVRINAAKQYLIGTKLSVSEISHLCGFNSPNYFYSVFQNYVGTTPLKFRKQFRS